MKWINLDCDWGLPAIRIPIRWEWIPHLPLWQILHTFTGSVEDGTRLEAWVAHIFGDCYPGAQVLTLSYESQEAVLVVTVLHPDFPRTPEGTPLPRWDLMVTDKDAAAGTFTLLKERKV